MDITVRRGAVHGFLGPNGAGKTTAIKILLGLIPSDAGEARVLGEPLTFGSKLNYLRYTNYLPQDPVFPDGLTGREALFLVADLYRLDRPRARKRVERLLEFFQLADAGSRRVGAYSRGMLQRLGLASVLLTEPELLILDEPVSALDPEGRRQMLEIIGRLRGRATVFFSSHILADVEKICDRVTIINRGLNVLEADTPALLNQYGMEQFLLAVPPEQKLQAAKIISQNPSVLKVEELEEKLLVRSKPGAAAVMSREVLPALVRAGLAVSEFTPHRANLEEVFFRALEENQREEGPK